MRRAAALATAALALAAPAHAATYALGYSFPITDTASFPSGQTAGFGVFTTGAPAPDGSALINGAGGLWSNQPITGLLAPGSYGGNDNLLFPEADPLLTQGGEVNLYAARGQYSEPLPSTGDGPFTLAFLAAEPANVPEPASFALLGLDLLSASATRRRAAARG